MPFPDIVDCAATSMPSRGGDLLMGRRRSVEMGASAAILRCWLCCFDHVQVDAPALPEQNASGLGFSWCVLAMATDGDQHPCLDQHLTTPGTWIVANQRGEHAGHPVSGVRFCGLSFLMSALSVVRVRKRGEGSPRIQSITRSLAKAAADMGADTAKGVKA